MRHFIPLVASLFGPISCSGSRGQRMAGMSVESFTHLVRDVLACLHSDIHALTKQAHRPCISLEISAYLWIITVYEMMDVSCA